jgi:CubicO group peptidase (beta-lactamase class C family)
MVSEPAAGGSGGVAEVLAQAVRAGEIPGAVLAAGAPGRPAEVVVAGAAQVLGGPRRPMLRDTLFDLASLTKVVATLPAVLRLAERGELTLDDRVTRFLPGFRGGGRDAVTVRQLLAHTAGLPAEVPYWRRYRDPDEAAQALLQPPLEHPPGSRAVYSDIGFMLLGRLVRAVTRAPLDVSVGELVTGPLGMTRTSFRPDAAAGGDRPAATELQPDGTALAGVVHDENARFLGGVAGHAGLFAPAGDLVRYLTGAWLGEGFLSPAAKREAYRPQTEAAGSGRRGLGWVLRGDPADFLGARWPRGSISHTGFTGTSLAVDPASGRWAVLLTNEVHFGRGRGVMRGLREAVHDRCAPAARPGPPAACPGPAAAGELPHRLDVRRRPIAA